MQPRGKVKFEEVSEQAYQVDDPSPFKVVVDIEILSNLCSILGEVDIIELPRQHSMRQADERRPALRMRKRNSTIMLKARVMKIVLNFQNNKVPSVLCLYLINICLTFSIWCIYILML